jgi:hypothetical protein
MFSRRLEYSCQEYFCYGTRRNAVLEVLSQKDANQNGVPERSFPGIGITNPRLRPSFGSLYVFRESRRSSVSIVSDYRGSIPDRGTKDFSCGPCVQTGSGAHPASYPMCTGGGGLFPAGKARPRRHTDHPSSAKVKNE